MTQPVGIGEMRVYPDARPGLQPGRHRLGDGFLVVDEDEHGLLAHALIVSAACCRCSGCRVKNL